MQGVVAADKFSVFMLASIYRRQRAALERDGMNPEEASENAAAALMHIVDKTAQTARTINTTQLQRAGGAWSLVLQFKSAPAQQTQFEIAAVQDALARKNDVAAWKKALAVLAINHLIVPAINTFIESALLCLTSLDFPPDEEKRKRIAAIFIANMISGSWGSVAFLGTVIEGAASAIADYSIEGKKPSIYTVSSQPVPAMSAVDVLLSNYTMATKALDEFNEGDITDAVIDLAAAIGKSVPGVAWPVKTAYKIHKSAKEK
jgi:hypothetical protein